MSTLMNKKTSKKEIFAWCLFDFANSSYTTVIVTVAFSIYFTSVVASGEDGTRLWGWGYSVSMLIVALMAPLLGAVADSGGYKKKFLLYFTLLCVTTTALLFFVEEGDIILGLFIFALSNIGFSGGMHFYNSFLIDISTKKNISRISGYGWALGYLGGLLALILIYPLIKDGFVEENLFKYRMSFIVTALFFSLFSIPIFIFLKERVQKKKHKAEDGGKKNSFFSHLSDGTKRLKETIHELKKFRELLKYFFCYLLYTDAVNTVIVFSAIYGSLVLGLSPGELIIYFIITQISAALGAFLSGPATEKVGTKNVISITLVLWIAVVVAAFFVQTKEGFYLIGLTAGAVLGANQSVSRALLGSFTPHGKNAEFFGFFALVGKFAAIIGPVFYGEVASATGSQRLAVLSLGLFFLAGLIMLQFIQVEKGIRAADDFENENHLQN